MLNIYILFIYYFNQLSAVLSFFYLCKMHSKYLYDLIENSSLEIHFHVSNLLQELNGF